MRAKTHPQRVKSTTTERMATCVHCNRTNTAANALGTAARHHDTTGHAVRVSTTQRLIYGDPCTTAIPGQTTIDDYLDPEATS